MNDLVTLLMNMKSMTNNKLINKQYNYISNKIVLLETTVRLTINYA